MNSPLFYRKQQSASLVTAFLLCLVFLFGAGRMRAQYNYAASDSLYTQTFDSLPKTGTISWVDNSTLAGWYAYRKNTANAPTSCTADDGTLSPSGVVYSYGTGTASDRAMGIIPAGTPGDVSIALRLHNTSGKTLTSFRIKYSGEQWRVSSPASKKLAFSYQFVPAGTSSGTVFTGVWSTANVINSVTNSPRLDFTGPKTLPSGSSSALNGNDPTNRVDGNNATVTNISWDGTQDLWVKWTNADGGGGNSGLAMDDFSFTATNSPLAIYYQNALDSVADTNQRIDAGDLTQDTRDVAISAYMALELDSTQAGADKAEKFLNAVFNAEFYDPTTSDHKRKLGTQTLGDGTFAWRLDNSDIGNNSYAVFFVLKPVSLVYKRFYSRLDGTFLTNAAKYLPAALTALNTSPVHYGVDYTNMFSQQLTSQLLLGEALGDSTTLAAGKANLASLFSVTAQKGIFSEYASPVYEEVTYTNLLAAYKFTNDPTAKAQCYKLLDLAAADLKANYFVGLDSMAGSHSRDYKYVTGAGETQGFYQIEGLSPVPYGPPGLCGDVFYEYLNNIDTDPGFTTSYSLVNRVSSFNLPDPFAQLNAGNSWILKQRYGFRVSDGAQSGQDRYSYMTADYSIGSASACYFDSYDKQIAASITGTSGGKQISVIYDNLDSPYGAKAGTKQQHLRNYVSTVQDKGFVLSASNLESSSSGYKTIGSNIIFPLTVDALYYYDSAIPGWTPIQPVITSGSDYSVIDTHAKDSVIGLRIGKSLVAFRIFYVDRVGQSPAGQQSTYNSVLKFDGGYKTDSTNNSDGMGRLVVYAYNAGTASTLGYSTRARTALMMAATTLPAATDSAAETFLDTVRAASFTQSMTGSVWQVTSELNNTTLTASVDTAANADFAPNDFVTPATRGVSLTHGVAPTPYVPDRFTVTSGGTLTDYASLIMGPVTAGPTDLAATSGDGKVDLAWSALDGALSYNIKRGTASAGPFATVGNSATAAYTDHPPTNNGTPYYYVVTDVIPAGEGGNSNVATGTAAPLPTAPTGVSATGGNAQVIVAWATATNATGYEVWRSTTSGSGYSRVNILTGTSYTDPGLSNGTPYYYVVKATDATGASPYSAEVTATPQVPPPATPTAFSGTPADTAADFTWNASPTATGYQIYRSNDGVNYSNANATLIPNQMYHQGGLTNGVTYYFKIAAVNAGGVGPQSSAITVVPQIPAPAAPTGFTGTPANGAADFTWNASATATGYQVYRSNDGVNYTNANANLIPNQMYHQGGLTNGVTYYFKIAGVNAGGAGPKSSVVAVVPHS